MSSGTLAIKELLMNTSHKRPTLQHIADHLGLTKMTISRYLRNPDAVAEETRKNCGGDRTIRLYSESGTKYAL